jgi:hypothetical protein
MKEFLKNLDFYGYQIQFNLNKRDRYNSLTGSVISLLVILFILYYSIISLIELINRQNMTVMSNSKTLENPPKINMAIRYGINLEFFMTKENGKRDYIDINKYFDFSLDQYSLIGMDYNITNIPLYECENYLCSNSSGIDYYIQGDADSTNDAVVLIITLSLKDRYFNSSFEQLFEGSIISFAMGYNTYGYDYENFENPITKFYETEYYQISKNKRHISRLKISKSEFTSDDDYFFNSPKTIEYLEYFFEKYETKDTTTNEILNILISSSVKFNKTSRSYQKLPDYLAGVSGLFGLISSVCQFLLDYLNNYSASNYIVRMTTKCREHHKLFYLKELITEESNRLMREFNSNDNDILSQVGENSNVNVNTKRSKSKFGDIENFYLGHIKSKTHRDLVFGKKSKSIVADYNFKKINNLIYNKRISDINLEKKSFIKCHDNHTILSTHLTSNLLKSCKFNKTQREIRDRLVGNEFENYMDIITYIRRLKDIELIKKILFNDQGKIVFDFCSRNLIALDKLVAENEEFNYKTNSEIREVFRNYTGYTKNNDFEQSSIQKLIALFANQLDSL